MKDIFPELSARVTTPPGLQMIWLFILSGLRLSACLQHVRYHFVQSEGWAWQIGFDCCLNGHGLMIDSVFRVIILLAANNEQQHAHVTSDQYKNGTYSCKHLQLHHAIQRIECVSACTHKRVHKCCHE